MSLPTQVIKALQEDFEASQHAERADWIADVITSGPTHALQRTMDTHGVAFEQVCAHLYTNG